MLKLADDCVKEPIRSMTRKEYKKYRKQSKGTPLSTDSWLANQLEVGVFRMIVLGDDKEVAKIRAEYPEYRLKRECGLAQRLL
ncbi:hypothetical protein KAR91_63065 [Candidatus Pacearchaeota archaeon]|nr:hypothetical protein [Candidatus Pacearchaeota archaeon]